MGEGCEAPVLCTTKDDRHHTHEHLERILSCKLPSLHPFGSTVMWVCCNTVLHCNSPHLQNNVMQPNQPRALPGWHEQDQACALPQVCSPRCRDWRRSAMGQVDRKIDTLTSHQFSCSTADQHPCNTCWNYNSDPRRSNLLPPNPQLAQPIPALALASWIQEACIPMDCCQDQQDQALRCTLACSLPNPCPW